MGVESYRFRRQTKRGGAFAELVLVPVAANPERGGPGGKGRRLTVGPVLGQVQPLAQVQAEMGLPDFGIRRQQREVRSHNPVGPDEQSALLAPGQVSQMRRAATLPAVPAPVPEDRRP